jgi:hypothetical protein
VSESSSSIRVFGVRHHGPGCARSLVSALDAMDPDVVLIEGPPDAAEMLPLAGAPEMKPPVALLVYPADAPGRAVFYPFADFSPEWQAIRFGLARGVPVRFMDLPQHHRLAEPAGEDAAGEDAGAAPAGGGEPDGGNGDDGGADERAAPAAEGDDEARVDPIGALAAAAGFPDGELWWEHEIERRRDPTGLFQGLLEAMRALRDGHPRVLPPEEARREAFMRQTIRAAVKEGRRRIAVVCGAWHAPVLAEPGPAKPDADLLKGLPRIKTIATWIPWTASRLSSRSGYGAGVNAPGWYQHLWQHPDQPTLGWTVRAARTLREEDLFAPTASVIESVRLAEALAGLRGLAHPGLREINDAMQAVLCAGAPGPLAFVRDRLELGGPLGEVPAAAPAVPLRRELEAEERRLRLKRSDEIKPLDLDLREATDRARSRLFHRLRLLDVEWAVPETVSGKAGTFHELWKLRWQPDLEIRIVEASRWGNTIAGAAGARAIDLAGATTELGPLTELLDRVVVAELEDALARVLAIVQERAAVASDVIHLAAALPRLARLARYGDVRGLAPEPVLALLDGIYQRLLVGLPNACVSLDDDASTAMANALGQVHDAVGLVDRPEMTQAWLDAAAVLAGRDATAPLVRGYAARLAHDKGRLGRDDLVQLAGRALSRAVPPDQVAAWLEGLLRGGALVLLHARDLWSVLDAWLVELSADALDAVLPLLRRAFSSFSGPERRSMGELVRTLRGGAPAAPAARAVTLDETRAALVLPVLAQVLGVRHE